MLSRATLHQKVIGWFVGWSGPEPPCSGCAQHLVHNVPDEDQGDGDD